MKKIIYVFLAVIIYNASYSQNITKQFTIEATAEINLKLKSRGKYLIKAWDEKYALFNLKYNKKEIGCESVEISGSKKSIDLIVESEKGRCENIDARISIPIENQLNIHSIDGELMIEGGKRKLSLNVLGGYYTIKNSEGFITIKAKGGIINLLNYKGEVDIEITGGTINIKDSYLDGKITTIGGTVILQNVAGNVEKYRIGGDIIEK